jgi:hypothetical protein
MHLLYVQHADRPIRIDNVKVDIDCRRIFPVRSVLRGKPQQILFVAIADLEREPALALLPDGPATPSRADRKSTRLWSAVDRGREYNVRIGGNSPVAFAIAAGWHNMRGHATDSLACHGPIKWLQLRRYIAAHQSLSR